MRNTLLFVVLGFTITVNSCWPIDDFGEPIFPIGEVEGYKPIYADEIDLNIDFEAPQPIGLVGQIMSINDFVLFVEAGKGIHIVDNSDITQPSKIGFISMNGVQQITLKDGILYASQYADLVALDITDLSQPEVIRRESEILNEAAFSNLVPPGNGYFICPDETKGRVVAWEFGIIESPKCQN